MAFRHGKLATLSLSSVSMQAYLDNAALNATRDTADTTVFGLNDRTSLAGLRGANITGSGSYDPTASTGPIALLWAAYQSDTAAAAIYYPGGNIAGQYSFTTTAFVTNVAITSAVADKVTFTFDLLVTGAVTAGIVGA